MREDVFGVCEDKSGDCFDGSWYVKYIETIRAWLIRSEALVQLFTIAITRPDAPRDGPSSESHIQKFARPLGATVVVMGLLVLLIGESHYFSI